MGDGWFSKLAKDWEEAEPEADASEGLFCNSTRATLCCLFGSSASMLASSGHKGAAMAVGAAAATFAVSTVIGLVDEYRNNSNEEQVASNEAEHGSHVDQPELNG